LTRRFQNIRNSFKNNSAAAALIVLLLLVWQGVSMAGWIPKFMLPSPLDVCAAFYTDFGQLMAHAGTTLGEAFIGLGAAVVLAFVIAYLMDRFAFLYKSVYPLLVISQTIPPVAVAPLLVLWMGYGMMPKITLVVVVCFFPLAVGLLDGYRSADRDTLNLMRAMGASRLQIFRYLKLPSSLGRFFAGLRISVSYSIVGAVIAEWLGGYNGLGVYMTRVKKAYAFDKMFAVIFLVSLLSLALMRLVSLVEKWSMPYRRTKT